MLHEIVEAYGVGLRRLASIYLHGASHSDESEIVILRRRDMELDRKINSQRQRAAEIEGSRKLLASLKTTLRNAILNGWKAVDELDGMSGQVGAAAYPEIIDGFTLPSVECEQWKSLHAQIESLKLKIDKDGLATKGFFGTLSSFATSAFNSTHLLALQIQLSGGDRRIGKDILDNNREYELEASKAKSLLPPIDDARKRISSVIDEISTTIHKISTTWFDTVTSLGLQVEEKLSGDWDNPLCPTRRKSWASRTPPQLSTELGYLDSEYKKCRSEIIHCYFLKLRSYYAFSESLIARRRSLSLTAFLTDSPSRVRQLTEIDSLVAALNDLWLRQVNLAGRSCIAEPPTGLPEHSESDQLSQVVRAWGEFSEAMSPEKSNSSVIAPASNTVHSEIQQQLAELTGFLSNYAIQPPTPNVRSIECGSSQIRDAAMDSCCSFEESGNDVDPHTVGYTYGGEKHQNAFTTSSHAETIRQNVERCLTSTEVGTSRPQKSIKLMWQSVEQVVEWLKTEQKAFGQDETEVDSFRNFCLGKLPIVSIVEHVQEQSIEYVLTAISLCDEDCEELKAEIPQRLKNCFVENVCGSLLKLHLDTVGENEKGSTPRKWQLTFVVSCDVGDGAEDCDSERNASPWPICLYESKDEYVTEAAMLTACEQLHNSIQGPFVRPQIPAKLLDWAYRDVLGIKEWKVGTEIVLAIGVDSNGECQFVVTTRRFVTNAKKVPESSTYVETSPTDLQYNGNGLTFNKAYIEGSSGFDSVACAVIQNACERHGGVIGSAKKKQKGLGMNPFEFSEDTWDYIEQVQTDALGEIEGGSVCPHVSDIERKARSYFGADERESVAEIKFWVRKHFKQCNQCLLEWRRMEKCIEVENRAVQEEKAEEARRKTERAKAWLAIATVFDSAATGLANGMKRVCPWCGATVPSGLMGAAIRESSWNGDKCRKCGMRLPPLN